MKAILAEGEADDGHWQRAKESLSKSVHSKTDETSHVISELLFRRTGT